MSQVNAASNMITFTLVEDKQSLVNLLERNGVRMPNNPSDNEIIVAVLASSTKSPNFKNELADLLTSKAFQIQKTFKTFVGDSSDFGFTGIDDFIGGDGKTTKIDMPNLKAKGPNLAALQPTQSAKISKDKKSKKEVGTGFGNFLRNLSSSATSKDTINAGINIGLTALNNRVSSKQNELQAQAAIITSQQDEAKQAIAAQRGSSTNTILIVGLAILVVGVLAYFVSKKK